MEGAPRVWGPGPSAKGFSASARQGQEHVRLQMGHPLSLVLFRIVMDIISAFSKIFCPVGFIGLGPYIVGWFAIKCETAEMRIPKSMFMVIDWTWVACHIRVGGEVLPHVEELKYLGALFSSEGKISARLIGGLVRPLELCGRKAKLLIYWSVSTPALTYGYEL